MVKPSNFKVNNKWKLVFWINTSVRIEVLLPCIIGSMNLTILGAPITSFERQMDVRHRGMFEVTEVCVIGDIKQGVTPEQVQEALANLAGNLFRTYEIWNVVIQVGGSPFVFPNLIHAKESDQEPSLGGVPAQSYRTPR